MLAESPQIPVGVVVMVLVLFALAVSAVAGVVVGGWVAAHRYGRDPSRTKARAVAAVCATLESVALGWAVVVVVRDPDALPALLAVAAVLAATAGAFGLGVRRRPPSDLGG